MFEYMTLKRYIKTMNIYYLLLIFVSIVFIGCGTNVENETLSDDNKKNNELGIRIISVTTAEQNDNRVWAVQWPNKVRTGSLSSVGDKLENAKEELSQEETAYFIDYVEAIEMMDSMDKQINNISKEDYEGHQYLGSVKIMYNDENGKLQEITRYIFDDYPAGYSEFIEKFGSICGEDYIPLDHNLQDVTVDYFRRLAQISILEPDEVVEEFINITECDMFQLLEEYNYYAAQAGIENINTYRHLPKELLSEASGENELNEYVKKLASKFEINESMIQEYEEGGYYFSSQYGKFEIYPSNKYPHPEYVREYDCECSRAKFYHIQDNGGSEGMVSAHFFVYSEDGKFMIVIPAETDENVNEIIKTIFDE